ncbi:MAG: hypothetical protein JW891_18995 [Candidatus Lokiarchaeota archaeon]|nr:hypothetical protein [Candidatus Lokiarchaeota archaeon]
MTFSRNTSILFDLAHNEMVNFRDEEFSEFANLLKSLGFQLLKNDINELKKKTLDNIDILIIGNPVSSYFSQIEIKTIVDFVRDGGCLLLLSEYGSDYIQKTNLNDLTGTYFGIFFEKNIIKEKNLKNQNCTSILSINEFPESNINEQLHEIIIGGTCSIILNTLAKPLLIKKGNITWSEVYNSAAQQWVPEENQINERDIILATYREYGRGKIVALGDIDLFTNDPNIGINKLDNRNFVINIFKWFTKPIKESSVRHWALDQLGSLQFQFKELNSKISNIIESLSLLEKRVSNLEKSFDEQNTEYK